MISVAGSDEVKCSKQKGSEMRQPGTEVGRGSETGGGRRPRERSRQRQPKGRVTSGADRQDRMCPMGWGMLEAIEGRQKDTVLRAEGSELRRHTGRILATRN